jgi:threonine aldolase
VIEQLRAQGAVFYQWPRHFVPSHFNLNEHDEVVRLVTSFRTTEEEIMTFVDHLKRCSNA